MANEIRNKERILEAIDQLRRRKARPDVNRICNFLSRRFSVSASETKADLQRCVDRAVVLKVEYKGNISYRNAAKKFSHLKRDSRGEIIRPYVPIKHQKIAAPLPPVSTKFTDLLTSAISDLIVDDPDCLEFGVPENELIKSILSKDNVRYTRKYVGILLLKQVECGGLIRMENGNYLVGPTKTEKTSDNDSDISSASNKDKYLIKIKPRKKPGPKPGWKKDNMPGENGNFQEKHSENGNLRVGGRRKRAKKVFDPSDNNIPKKRGRPVGSLNKSTIEKQLAKLSDNDSRPESRSSSSGRDLGGVCSVCHLQNKKGPERMVACRECSNKAHFSCLNGEDMMLRMYPDNTWQCPHCKTCVVCFETSDAGNLTVCSICADGYHGECHQPRITEKLKTGQKWLCVNCQMPDELAVNEIESNIGNKEATIKYSSSLNGKASPSETEDSRSAPSSPTPPLLSPQMHNGNRSPSNMSDSQSLKDLDFEESFDPTIPDASNWTYNEVYQYFARLFPEEAKVFKEQEIDGRSLLLMKRSDVITGLKLKLGPALKIYRQVVKLQLRRDDPKLYWL